MGFSGRSAAFSAVIFILSFSLNSLHSSTTAARDLEETKFKSLPAPEVPAQIRVPEGYKLHLLLSAKGYQYYEFNGSSWVNNNATASLYNWQKREVGLHYYLPQPDTLGGQPSWDTLPSKGFPYSSVSCKVKATVIEGQDNVAWALLGTTQSSGDKKYFGNVAFVQRYNTYHGAAPPLKHGDKKGQVRKSPYTCDYAYYVPSME